jgi:hypothetical protein
MRRAIRNLMTESQLLNAASLRSQQQVNAFTEGANGNSRGTTMPMDEASEILKMAEEERNILG